MSKSSVEILANLPTNERLALLGNLTDAEAQELFYKWEFWARPEQLTPKGDWFTWIILAGRGFGKTRAGAEFVRQRVDQGAKSIALIGETAKDARDVMVEGESGLLEVFPPHQKPTYIASKATVEFHTGAKAIIYNATEPNQLRGPQFDTAWCDELAKWRYAQETWDMLQFGMRKGKPRQIVTTTPRNIPLLQELIKDSSTHVTTGSTFDNRANLAGSFLDKVKERYEGTRLGRQELYAEVLTDIAGALWTRKMLEDCRRAKQPELNRIVVSVDPAVTSGEEANEHGIVVCGSDGDQHGWVLDDASMSGSPSDWASRAISKHDEWEAEGIVVEVNQGGEMVASTLRTIRPNIKIIEVRATRGKHLRAEPVAALYEQQRVHHLGSFPQLEDQLCGFTAEGWEGGRSKGDSPDRADALVHGLTCLFPSIVKRVKSVDHEAIQQRQMVMRAAMGSNYG